MTTVSREEFEELKKAFNEYIEKSTAPAPAPAPAVKKQRPLSKYQLFMQEELKKIKADNKDMHQKEIFKIAIKKWNEVKTKD